MARTRKSNSGRGLGRAWPDRWPSVNFDPVDRRCFDEQGRREGTTRASPPGERDYRPDERRSHDRGSPVAGESRRPRARRRGWFVVNVRDTAWLPHDAFGSGCVFESRQGARRFGSSASTSACCNPGSPRASTTRRVRRRTSRPRGRVRAARERRGAAPQGVGLRALTGRDGARHCRRRRRAIDRPRRWRAPRTRAAALPALRARRAARGKCRGGHDGAPRSIRPVRPPAAPATRVLE
jgi:hypothetical protein